MKCTCGIILAVHQEFFRWFPGSVCKRDKYRVTELEKLLLRDVCMYSYAKVRQAIFGILCSMFYCSEVFPTRHFSFYMYFMLFRMLLKLATNMSTQAESLCKLLQTKIHALNFSSFVVTFPKCWNPLKKLKNHELSSYVFYFVSNIIYSLYTGYMEYFSNHTNFVLDLVGSQSLKKS